MDMARTLPLGTFHYELHARAGVEKRPSSGNNVMQIVQEACEKIDVGGCGLIVRDWLERVLRAVDSSHSLSYSLILDNFTDTPTGMVRYRPMITWLWENGTYNESCETDKNSFSEATVNYECSGSKICTETEPEEEEFPATATAPESPITQPSVECEASQPSFSTKGRLTVKSRQPQTDDLGRRWVSSGEHEVGFVTTVKFAHSSSHGPHKISGTPQNGSEASAVDGLKVSSGPWCEVFLEVQAPGSEGATVRGATMSPPLSDTVSFGTAGNTCGAVRLPASMATSYVDPNAHHESLAATSAMPQAGPRVMLDPESMATGPTSVPAPPSGDRQSGNVDKPTSPRGRDPRLLLLEALAQMGVGVGVYTADSFVVTAPIPPTFTPQSIGIRASHAEVQAPAVPSRPRVVPGETMPTQFPLLQGSTADEVTDEESTNEETKQPVAPTFFPAEPPSRPQCDATPHPPAPPRPAYAVNISTPLSQTSSMRQSYLSCHTDSCAESDGPISPMQVPLRHYPSRSALDFQQSDASAYMEHNVDRTGSVMDADGRCEMFTSRDVGTTGEHWQEEQPQPKFFASIAEALQDRLGNRGQTADCHGVGLAAGTATWIATPPFGAAPRARPASARTVRPAETYPAAWLVSGQQRTSCNSSARQDVEQATSPFRVRPASARVVRPCSEGPPSWTAANQESYRGADIEVATPRPAESAASAAATARPASARVTRTSEPPPFWATAQQGDRSGANVAATPAAASRPEVYPNTQAPRVRPASARLTRPVYAGPSCFPVGACASPRTNCGASSKSNGWSQAIAEDHNCAAAQPEPEPPELDTPSGDSASSPSKVRPSQQYPDRRPASARVIRPHEPTPSWIPGAQAKSANAYAEKETTNGTSDPVPVSPTTPSGGRTRPAQATRGARAEAFRNKIRQLIKESEAISKEYDRLASEEAVQHEQMSAKRSVLGDRLRSAAKEIHTSYANLSSEEAANVPPSSGKDTQSHAPEEEHKTHAPALGTYTRQPQPYSGAPTQPQPRQQPQPAQARESKSNEGCRESREAPSPPSQPQPTPPRESKSNPGCRDSRGTTSPPQPTPPRENKSSPGRPHNSSAWRPAGQQSPSASSPCHGGQQRGAATSTMPASASRATPPAQPASSDHEAAWARLEQRLENGAGPIRYAEIPWPPAFGPGAITLALSDRQGPAAKRQITTALRRWHPDKWQRILGRVPESEQELVMKRVKSIAQQLLDLRARV